MRKMSSKIRGNVKWDSSTEEEEEDEEMMMSDVKFGMKLRESMKNPSEPTVSENETTTPSRRRGRGPSKRPCLNRNALMARENRLRKKAYLEKIENKLSFYQEENKNLANTIKKQSIDIKRLTTEVAYLRSVLNNNTNITVLLKTINDGLKRIGTLKKTTCHSNNTSHAHSCNSDTQRKCGCHLSIKENNVLNQQNTNIYINTANESYAEQNGMCQPQGQFGGSYPNARRQSNFDIRQEVENKALPNSSLPVITSGALPQDSEDSLVDNIKEYDGLLQLNQENLCGTEEKKDLDLISTDFDQLPSFNMDIFEDLPKCDEILNTVHGLHDASSLFNDEDMFQSLDNTGICLHVNSDKVSLEFCSICHTSSKNAGLN